MAEFHGGQQGSVGEVIVGVGDGVARGVGVALAAGVGLGIGVADGVAVGVGVGAMVAPGPQENWPPIIVGRPAVEIPDESEGPMGWKVQDGTGESAESITPI